MQKTGHRGMILPCRKSAPLENLDYKACAVRYHRCLGGEMKCLRLYPCHRSRAIGSYQPSPHISLLSLGTQEQSLVRSSMYTKDGALSHSMNSCIFAVYSTLNVSKTILHHLMLRCRNRRGRLIDGASH